MNCKRCGTLKTDGDQFCKGCGASFNEIGVSQSTPEVRTPEFMATPSPIEWDNLDQPNIQPVEVQQPVFQNNIQPVEVQQPVFQNNIQPVEVQQSVFQNNIQPVEVQQPITQPVFQNTVPPVVNGQPINNGYNQNIKKTNKIIPIAVGVVGVVLFGVACLFVGKTIFAGNNVTDSDNDTEVVVQTSNTYKVTFKGFTFNIPDDLVYEITTDSLSLGDEAGTWAAYVEVIEGSYAQVVSNKSQLQTSYQNAGYTANAAVEKQINGTSFVTIEVVSSGQKCIVGATKANSMNIFGVTTYNLANTYDYSVLETISTILASSTYNEATTNITTFSKPEISVISEIAK